MTANSKFESRTGHLSCSPVQFFSFITDIRNFEQFIPAGSIKDWQTTADQCSFQIPPLGSANVRISGKTPFSLVKFSGVAMQNNNFELSVYISENESKLTDVRMEFSAELNPFLRMMASEPIDRFLEMLISEMEKNRNWEMRST